MKGNEIEKIEFYQDNKIKIHIETRDLQFYNGLIIEHSDKHLIILDRYVGQVFIYFQEITSFEKFKEAKE